MARFLFPVDICNRGLQHIGAPLIDPSLGFTEISPSSKQTAFVYDKLRRAELQENSWRFAIKEAALRPMASSTMFLSPSLWSQTTTYYKGSIVSDQNGTLWISNRPQNVGNDPLNTSAWDVYFGPLAVQPWDTTGTTAYYAGELVYIAPGDGTYKVYLSNISSNTDNPATATAWDPTVTYGKDQIVTESSTLYASLIDLNLNQDPASTFVAAWASGTTYAAGNKATGSDGVIYQSIGSGNVGNDPTTDGGVHWTNTGVLSPWTTTNLSGSGSLNWLQLQAPVLVQPNILYPLSAGPVVQSSTRNMFRLPANFLRKAPQDPKAGSFSALGAPSNRQYDDWNFDGDYITSRLDTLIVLRFVADIADVTKMDDLFCEGLGARIGLEVCEPVTQSTAKKQAVASEWLKAINTAKLQNAIIESAEDPPLDDWVACRA